MSYWYQAKLGDRGKAVETGAKLALQIASPDGGFNGGGTSARACIIRTWPYALPYDSHVLAWRAIYGDLLGKPREAVVEGSGTPERQKGAFVNWRASVKTQGRPVSIGFETGAKGDVAKAVRVFARTTESLDPLEVLRKADMLTPSTGTY